MKITATKNGLRLSEHGVVISELRTSPGPTHSVFDVMAAIVNVLQPTGRVGILGFAGGGIMAPLHALGLESVIDSVDLDRTGFDLFRRHCPIWASRVNWEEADAVAWLRRQTRKFGLLIDDLSVPENADVIKPLISWTILPELIRRRLRPDGFAVFNLLPRPNGNWSPYLKQLLQAFGTACVVDFDDFVNRILIVGAELPSARELGFLIRRRLRQLQSRQAQRIRLSGLDPNSARGALNPVRARHVSPGPVSAAPLQRPANARTTSPTHEFSGLITTKP